MVIHFLPHLTNVSALYQAKHGNAKIANVKCCATYSLPVQPADGGGDASMHAWALGLTSLHPTASASLCDGSAVIQQLRADYPLYSPGGTTVHRHVT